MLKRVDPDNPASDRAAVGWLIGVRSLGLEWANEVEDRRLAAEAEERREVSFIETLATILIEDCDLAGTTYEFNQRIYFMPWADHAS